MTKVSGAAYGRRPKLTPEALDGDARVVVRIKEAGSFERSDGGESYWLTTVNPPDHILFLNGPDLRILVGAFGDETEKWEAQRVVIELVKRPYRGQVFEKYAIAPQHEWTDVIRPLASPAPPKKPRKRVAAK